MLRMTRDGRPQVASSRRARMSRQTVVITALTVISTYCGKVTNTASTGACPTGHNAGTKRRQRGMRAFPAGL